MQDRAASPMQAMPRRPMPDRPVAPLPDRPGRPIPDRPGRPDRPVPPIPDRPGRPDRPVPPLPDRPGRPIPDRPGWPNRPVPPRPVPPRPVPPRPIPPVRPDWSWNWGTILPGIVLPLSPARVRFYNASVRGPIQIYVNNRLVVSNLNFLNYSRIYNVIPGRYRITVYRGNDMRSPLVDTWKLQCHISILVRIAQGYCKGLIHGSYPPSSCPGPASARTALPPSGCSSPPAATCGRKAPRRPHGLPAAPGPRQRRPRPGR